MCLDGRAAAVLVAAASIVGGLADTPGQHPSATSPSPAASSQRAATAGADRVTVTVRLEIPGQRKLSNATVSLNRELDGAGGRDPVDKVAILADGSFVFSDVPPGTYRIHARATIGAADPPLVALYRIVVHNRDIAVPLALRPGASVSGRVIVDQSAGSTPPSFSGLQIQASAADSADTTAADVLRDGSFRITGVAPGRQFLAVKGLSGRWALDRVTYRGADISDRGLDATSGESIRDIRVAVSDRASDVSGTVRDSDGRVVSGATVLLIPHAPQFLARTSRRFGITTSGQDGRYRYRGLPGGEYHVTAVLIDPEDVYVPELLQQLSAAGAPLTLAPLAAAVIDLRLTPAPDMRRTSAR
jgi:hypothetical protein